MLNRFARMLTQNVLLLREADSDKIQITSLEWATLKRRYQDQLDTLRLEMGLQDGDSPIPAWPPASARRWRASRSSSTSTT